MSIHSLLLEDGVDDKYDELKLLIEADYSVLQSTYGDGDLPIHIALLNPHVTLRVVQLLLNGWPESISQPNRGGDFPIHYLCWNEDLDEAVSVNILIILIEAFPESVRRGGSTDGDLPIHAAARSDMSLEFLKVLVNAYPESVGILDANGSLPIHLACGSDEFGNNCKLDNVEYLLDVYPEGINVGGSSGNRPIHTAAYSCGSQKADIIKSLLMKDPTCASRATETGDYPLHLTCRFWDGNLSAVRLLFDAYPEAIVKRGNEGKTPLELVRDYNYIDNTDDVIAFLETQLVYAEKSQDVSAMTKLDKNGWTILHRALKENAPLGSIKLLVKGSAVLRVADYNMAFPLHVACEFSSLKVVQYLIEMLDERLRNHLDANDDSIFHYACRGGNCEVVKYLLERQSPHVSERNADEKLPIHLFCQFGLPSNSLEHTDTNYRLLLAYPKTL